MKKGRKNYEDELYEDEDYDDYDENDDDYYYDDDYGEDYEEEEEEKPKKNKNNKKNTKSNQNQTQNKNQNQNKKPNQQSKNQNQNKINTINQINNSNDLSLSKNTSNNISSQTFSSMTSIESKKEEKEKEKPIISIKDLNNLKAYPKIEYGKKYTDNNDEKPTINLVIIGHVDSGKSTMIGHLLLLLNEINKKEVHKNLKVKSNKDDQNKETLNFAFATDEATDERERGVTIDISYKHFSTKTKNVLALDAPGHKDFIPNMIAGTSSADAALLVIDSSPNAFDAGFYEGGQTKEHALLARTLGVGQLIVAVNKLELVNWKQERFDEIVKTLDSYLVDELGFDRNKIKFIPVSGLTGDNLNKKISDKNAEWYKGPTLVELIDLLEPPQRAINAPVRFIINDISKKTNSNSLILFGKLESGIIIKNSEYLIMPVGNKEKIKDIVINKKSVQYMTPGQQGEIHINSNKSSKEELIVTGNVLSSEKYPVPCVKKFKAHIKTYNLKTPISLGQKMMFYLQGQKTQIAIKKIERIFNEGSTVSKNNTRFIPKNYYADIIIESENTICAELYLLNKKLSTFTLRISGETQAMGYITEFLE